MIHSKLRFGARICSSSRSAVPSQLMAEPLSSSTIDEHVARLTSERVVTKVMGRIGGDRDRITATLNTYAAECRYGARLMTKRLPASGRILEVGAGLGMLSSYFRGLGYDITALEPCTSGFDFFTEF